MKPDISVIIPTHGRPDKLHLCLRSCFHQSETKFEVVVVINPADHALERKIRQTFPNQPNLMVLQNSRAGVGAAKNMALNAVSAKIIYFLDDDCEIRRPDHFRRLLEYFRRYPRAAAIGGPYEGRSLYNDYARLWLDWHRTNSTKARALLGGNTAYRRRIFASGMRFPDVIYGGEETQINNYLLDRGESLHLMQDLSVNHHADYDFWNCLGRSWKQGRRKTVARNATHYVSLGAIRQVFGKLSGMPPSRFFALGACWIASQSAHKLAAKH